MALKRPKDISELATELEALLRRMPVEQLQEVLELPVDEDQDGTAIAKRLAERELAGGRFSKPCKS
jgi:hypothetical protein